MANQQYVEITLHVPNAGDVLITSLMLVDAVESKEFGEDVPEFTIKIVKSELKNDDKLGKWTIEVDDCD